MYRDDDDLDLANEEGDIGDGLSATRRTSFDLDRLTDREKGVASSRISRGSLWAEHGIVTGALSGGKGYNSEELVELIDSCRPRFVKGRSALAKNWLMRVRGLYNSTNSSGSG